MFKGPEKLRIVQLADTLADKIWDEVIKWNYFAKNTLGMQIVDAADSIGANIVESLGRFHIKEQIRFLHISRGSLWETKRWLNRALRRKLLATKKFEESMGIVENLAPQLNAFITKKHNDGV